MTVKTTVCAAAAVLIGLISNASAGDFYPNESTNAWFSVDVSAADLDTSVWTKPSDGSATKDGSVIVLDTDNDDPLVYTPGGTSGDIALVNASIVVSPNESVPAITGLTDAQAALTTVTNTTSNYLEWYGLVSDGSEGPEWVALEGDHPVVGQTYDIMITLDNRAGQKTIRYSVKGPGAASYVNLTSGGNAWLDNPKDNMSSISAVAFSGVGRFGDFGASDVVNNAITIDSTGEIAGFDFAGGSVTARVTVASGIYTGKKAVLTVVDFATGTSSQVGEELDVTAGGALSWDLSSLTPGGTYSYTVTVKDGGVARVAQSGTFSTANWGADGSWFSTAAAAGEIVNNNGVWSDTYLVPAPTVTNDTQLSIYGDASFLITDKDPGTNALSRVDTKYSFETFVSTNALQAAEDAVSGIVAATNGLGAAWYVYAAGGWTKMDDGVTPEANAEYVMRAEFDFKSATKRVRYLLSSDNGATFVPLTLASAQWINLVNQEKTTLSEVSISGKGILTSINAEVADPSVAQVGGNRYATLWDAVLAAGESEVTLLTNATLAPSGTLARRKFRILNNGYELKYDNAASEKWWIHQKDGYWYLMKIGGTYIFQ